MPRTKCGCSDSPDGKVKAADVLVAIGPTLLVNIGFDAKYSPNNPTVPQASANNVWALVDTGATECCIDGALAKQLNLPLINRRPIAGATGSKVVDIHLAQIHVPSLSHTVYGEFAAVDLAAGGQQHKALIGRTFLRSFTLIYTGSTGDVELYS